MGEDDFLRAVLADPKDDSTLLVYSDWLEERGDPASAAKAEFLRLTAEGGEEKARGERLQLLAAGLDTDWLGVVSRLRIENCQGKRKEEERAAAGRRMRPLRFEFLCDRRWEDLRPTGDRGVRFCDGCRKDVHYCDTITVAREHARQGHCVAVDLGVIRRKNDLSPIRQAWLGRVSAEHLREREELEGPDPVSAERERRKREAGEKA